MTSIRVVLYAVTAALASPAASVGAQDALDEIIAGLTPAQQEALLQGASERDIVSPDGTLLSEQVDAISSITWVPVYSQSAAGGSHAVPASGANDAVWTLNAPGSATGVMTEVWARVVHGGFLTTASGTTGWDHLAILTRGGSLESALQWLGFGSSAPNPFFYGEQLQPAPQATLQAALRGRGPTFWAKGHPFCAPQVVHPCMLIENFTVNWSGPGVITEAPVALPISADPFDVRIETTNGNVLVSVWQNGQFKASLDCAQLRPTDNRCVRQTGDNTSADVIFGFVMGSVQPGHTSKPLGIVNPSVTMYRPQLVPPCPGCPIP